MVRQEGLEPPTYCLEGSCSIQLSYWRIMERVTGIEPASQLGRLVPWPLCYTRGTLTNSALESYHIGAGVSRAFLLFWGFAAHLALLGGWPNWRR